MGHNTRFWGEAIEGRCQALRAREPVTEAARLISQALDLNLITFKEAKVVNHMSSGQQLGGWLCALSADVALTSGELVAGGEA